MRSNLSERTFFSLIGASLSEPHIDHDNGPRHGESICIWQVCPPNVPENMPIQSITRDARVTCIINGNAHAVNTQAGYSCCQPATNQEATREASPTLGNTPVHRVGVKFELQCCLHTVHRQSKAAIRQQD